MMMKCLHCKLLIITHQFAGAEKLKIQTKSSDLHVFMEDGCELLILGEEFEARSKQRDSSITDCEG